MPAPCIVKSGQCNKQEDLRTTETPTDQSHRPKLVDRPQSPKITQSTSTDPDKDSDPYHEELAHEYELTYKLDSQGLLTGTVGVEWTRRPFAYHMTKLGAWNLRIEFESCCEAVTAFRNLRWWMKKK